MFDGDSIAAVCSPRPIRGAPRAVARVGDRGARRRASEPRLRAADGAPRLVTAAPTVAGPSATAGRGGPPSTTPPRSRPSPSASNGICRCRASRWRSALSASRQKFEQALLDVGLHARSLARQAALELSRHRRRADDPRQRVAAGAVSVGSARPPARARAGALGAVSTGRRRPRHLRAVAARGLRRLRLVQGDGRPGLSERSTGSATVVLAPLGQVPSARRPAPLGSCARSPSGSARSRATRFRSTRRPTSRPSC